MGLSERFALVSGGAAQQNHGTLESFTFTGRVAAPPRQGKMETGTSTRRLPASGMAREMVVIVVSIVIAFAIDAGWDARQEHVREVEVLADLVAEADANIEALDTATARQKLRVQLLEILLADTSEPQSLIGVDSLGTLGRVYFTASFMPRTGVMRELVASGDMRILQSRDLRKRLAGFDEAIATYLGNSASIRERYLEPTRDFVGATQWAERPLSDNAREVRNYLRWVSGMTRLVVGASEDVANELIAIRTLAGGT